MKNLLYFLMFISLIPLSSCLKDDETDYTDWMNRNNEYYNNTAEMTDESGNKLFRLFTPVWAQGCPVLLRWHNPRNPDAVRPMDNSLCDIVYELKDIDGKTIDNSFANTTYGDSIYRTRPNANITGFWTAMTQMTEGDSITAVLPYVSAYGTTGSASVKPYSTLIFSIKLKKIVKWELP